MGRRAGTPEGDDTHSHTAGSTERPSLSSGNCHCSHCTDGEIEAHGSALFLGGWFWSCSLDVSHEDWSSGVERGAYCSVHAAVEY